MTRDESRCLVFGSVFQRTVGPTVHPEGEPAVAKVQFLFARWFSILQYWQTHEPKRCRAYPVEGERVGICKTVHPVLDLEEFACSSFVFSLVVCRPCFANCRGAPPHSHRWGYAGRCCCCLRSVHVECLLWLVARVLACPHLDVAGSSLLGLWINHVSMEKRPLPACRSMPTLEIMSEFLYIQVLEAV